MPNLLFKSSTIHFEVDCADFQNCHLFWHPAGCKPLCMTSAPFSYMVLYFTNVGKNYRDWLAPKSLSPFVNPKTPVL